MKIPSPSITCRTLSVDQNHPRASDSNEGDRESPLRSIQAAAERAMPGDTVRVHAGIYRERVSPARGGETDSPITYEAAPGERVVVRGSDLWRPEWRAVSDAPGVYIGLFGKNMFGDFAPFRTPLNSAVGRKTLGQVFVDGVPLHERDWEEDVDAVPGSWRVLPGGEGLRIHFPRTGLPPEEREVEIAVRKRIFAPLIRGLGYIVVRGFVMEHCANDFPRGFWESDSPQAGALGMRGGHHWVVERNIIRFVKTVGLDCGSEGRCDADGLDQPEPSDSGYHLIRDNEISDNGSAGIMGYHTPGTRILGNTLERNNRLGFTAPETAAIKLHFFVGGHIEGNLIRDNDTAGIWLDNVWHDSRVTRNVIVANQGAGLFIEMGQGPLVVDHNVIAFTRATTALGGDGVYSHDSSGVQFAHNLLFFNANFGLWVHLATDRKYFQSDGGTAPVSASDWRIRNNLVIGNHRGALSLPPESEHSRDNRSDGNVFSGAYESLTQESHAAALAAPDFLLNTNKGRDEADSEAPHLLDLDAWRSRTGQDVLSRYLHVLRPMLSARSLTLDWIMDSRLAEVETETIEGLTHDFFGSPLPGTRPLPGPFQSMVLEKELAGQGIPLLHRGPYNHVKGERNNHFILWPLRVKDPRGPIHTAVEVVEDFERDF
ncbi:MAG: right-handed parallel beta-helix repeat-containing protein [Opitutales bacterium]